MLGAQVGEYQDGLVVVRLQSGSGLVVDSAVDIGVDNFWGKLVTACLRPTSMPRTDERIAVLSPRIPEDWLGRLRRSGQCAYTGIHLKGVPCDFLMSATQRISLGHAYRAGSVPSRKTWQQ